MYYRSSTDDARFTFNYGDDGSEARWYHFNSSGDSAALAEGFSTVGYVPDFSFADGGSILYTPTTGWNYSYNYGADRGDWARTDNGTARFSYGYQLGQRYHFDEWGAHALGPASLLPSSFMGSGARYDITTGAHTWWYSYDYTGDRGQWAVSDTDPLRFSYGYGDGQWYQHEDLLGNAGYALGFAGQSVTDFMGSGEHYRISSGPNNAWWYRYDYGSNCGEWYQSESDSFRFRYLYGPGQWFHAGYSGPAQTLGQAGTSLAYFIGDGFDHVITPAGVDEWRYRFDYTADRGYWNRSDKGDRFSYAYDTGQWYQHSLWDHGSAIGPSQYYVDAFFGDGYWHGAPKTFTSGNWSYQYDYGTDTGFWSRAGGPLFPIKFSYDYTNGRWYDHPAYGAVYQLGADTRSSQFLGY